MPASDILTRAEVQMYYSEEVIDAGDDTILCDALRTIEQMAGLLEDAVCICEDPRRCDWCQRFNVIMARYLATTSDTSGKEGE